MKKETYSTTTSENFGVIKEVTEFKKKAVYEVIMEKHTAAFIYKNNPDLLNFDGQRVFTSTPESLQQYVYGIASPNNYKLIFIEQKKSKL